MRLQASDDEGEARAVRALMKPVSVVPQRVPRGTVPGGEARNIHIGGGRYVSLLGSGPAFHTRQDRWPAAAVYLHTERLDSRRRFRLWRLAWFRERHALKARDNDQRSNPQFAASPDIEPRTSALP